MTEIAAELHMSRGQKITNLLGVTIPFAGFLASIFFFWGQYVTWRDLVIFAVGYALTTLGISIGFHRLFTHRSYETFKSIRYGLAVLGSMAVQGPVIRWVSDHRKHHSFADREGDPHSPHAGFGPGLRGKIAGLWHAHVGWLFRNVGRAEWTKYAKDLLADRGMVFISRWFGLWVGLSLLLPFIAGWLWGGTVGAGLQALFWGGLIRIFLLHHITWSVNSVCHFVGSRRFRVKDESRNVWWLSWISFGESWHHNHHAFPSSAFHGLKPWELDIGGLVIRLMRRLGLVWKVNVPSRGDAAAPPRSSLLAGMEGRAGDAGRLAADARDGDGLAALPATDGPRSSAPASPPSRSSCRCSIPETHRPSGERVRLADFAGERPVALVFGSYT